MNKVIRVSGQWKDGNIIIAERRRKKREKRYKKGRYQMYKLQANINRNDKDLKKYYKLVMKCKRCGRKYGSDTKNEKKPGLCPICAQVDEGKGSQLKRSEKHHVHDN